MRGDFDEDEYDDEDDNDPLVWVLDGRCFDCGAYSDERCSDDCECDDCCGIDL